MTRAVIWDMDGTLIDSGPYHWESWRVTMEQEGRPISYEEFASTFGQRNDAILRGWIRADLPTAEIARIADAKEALYREYVYDRGIALLPGIEQWLLTLQKQGWRQAIASSAPRANLDAILDVLQLHPLFAATVAAEDVQHGKPDPEVFLRAAERLGVAPTHSIVVEDATAGIAGALRAGMHTIGVGPNYQQLPADYAVQSLADLPCDAFDRLVPQQ